MDFNKYDSCPKIKCEAFQEVIKTEYTPLGKKCAFEWEVYYEQSAVLCRGDVCLTPSINPPKCEAEKKTIWRRLVGMCDDGIVRWREVKQ